MSRRSIGFLDWRVTNRELEAMFDAVLARIPDEDVARFPSISVVEGRSRTGAHVDVDEQSITLDADWLLRQLRSIAEGTIALALASFCARPAAPKRGRPDAHYETDELARSWGFDTELEDKRRYDLLYPAVSPAHPGRS